MNKKKEILHLKIKKRRFKLLYKKLINIKKMFKIEPKS